MIRSARVRVLTVLGALLIALAASASPALARPLYWSWYYYMDASGNVVGYEHYDDCSGYSERWGERTLTYRFEQEQCDDTEW